ncbi:MAG: PDK repeat-containing protein [Bacteroidetes bacterium]|nr:MAG: PDK repeat-containing protein [Bacteroidota bacterium]
MTGFLQQANTNMKNLKMTLLLMLPFAISGAQCVLYPTVTPNNLILCPQTSDTLWTQSFQTYQWYKGTNAIPGETNQYLVVDAFNDAGYYFSVAVTQDTCSGTSPQVLVDGWAFLPPFVITDGDPGTIDSNGVPHHCPGDTVLLIAGMPYDTLLQWYDNGSPIPGANDDTLVVTSTGNFTMSGAPSLCPNFVQSLGVTIPFQFSPVLAPAITMQGNMLVCSIPSGVTYQWYLNGNSIPGATSVSYTPAVTGNYTVEVTDANGCTFMSNVYSFTVGIYERTAGSFSIYPNPAGESATIIGESMLPPGIILVRDITGRLVESIAVHAHENKLELNTAQLENGMYFLELLNEKQERQTLLRLIIKK